MLFNCVVKDSATINFVVIFVRKLIPMRGWCLFFILFLVNHAYGQRQPDYSIDVSLGSTTVKLHVYKSKVASDLVFAHVHENETASLEAAIALLDECPGTIISLAHSPEGQKNRNVTFQFRGSIFMFDPNRIYTDNDAVLKNNIKRVAGQQEVNDEVMKEVRKLSAGILKEVQKANFIIALHNNRNAPVAVRRRWFMKDILVDASYNVNSYTKVCDHASDSNQSCEEIYINPKMNNSEFFIATQKSDFDKLSKAKTTVVLQNQNPVDDGSMSVWAASHQKRYVNVEAKMGRINEQMAMIKTLCQFK